MVARSPPKTKAQGSSPWYTVTVRVYFLHPEQILTMASFLAAGWFGKAGKVVVGIDEARASEWRRVAFRSRHKVRLVCRINCLYILRLAILQFALICTYFFGLACCCRSVDLSSFFS